MYGGSPNYRYSIKGIAIRLLVVSGLTGERIFDISLSIQCYTPNDSNDGRYTVRVYVWYRTRTTRSSTVPYLRPHFYLRVSCAMNCPQGGVESPSTYSNVWAMDATPSGQLHRPRCMASSCVVSASTRYSTSCNNPRVASDIVFMDLLKSSCGFRPENDNVPSPASHHALNSS